MKNNTFVRNTLSVCVASQFLLIGGPALAAEAMILEEVVVQARRVEESMQAVPVAVAAINSESINNLTITSFEDVRKNLPALQIRPDNTGTQSFRIRGSFAEQFSDPSVFTYLDDSPVDPRGINYSIFDLASIQELRGPQGTLFGKNSTGGAVLFFSNTPSLDGQEGYLRGRAGNYDEQYVEGAYNVPVGDTLAVRAAGQWENRDGFVESTTNTNLDYNNRDNYGLRGSALWRPSERLENITQLTKLDVDQRATPLQVERPGAPTAPDKTWSDFEWPEKYQYDALNNITTYELDAFTVKNIFNISKTDQKFGRSFGGLPSPVVIYDININSKIDAYYEELQFFGNTMNDKLDWRVGGVYSYIDTDEKYYPNAGGNRTSNLTKTEATSYAIYAQGTYDLAALLEGLRFTLGGRQTWDERDQDKQTYALDSAGNEVRCTLDGNPDPCHLKKNGSYDDYTYNISLDWQFTDDMMAYVATRRGYKSGGFNTAVPPNNPDAANYGPEIVEDVEIGLKADWSIGGVQLRSNIAVYDAEYNGILIPYNYVDTSTGSLYQLLSNVGRDGKQIDATMKGYEIEQTIVLTDWLQFTGFYAKIDSEYDHYVSNADGVDYSGQSVGKVVPENYGITMDANLSFPEAWGDLGLVVNYTGAAKAETTATGDRTPSQNQTDARLSLDRVMESNLDLAVYGKNITDEENYYFITPVLPGRFYSEPRTWGVELTYHFGS